MTTRSRGRCSGNGLRDGRLRSNGFDRGGIAAAMLGRQFVLGWRRLQLLELKLHLFEQPRLALGAAAVEVAPELLDLQLQPRDQRLRRRS